MSETKASETTTKSETATPSTGEVWSTCQRSNSGSPPAQRQRYWTGSVGAALPATVSGQLRYSVVTDKIYSLDDWYTGTGIKVLREWDPATRTQVRELDLSDAMGTFDEARLWGLRIDGDHLFFPGVTGGNTGQMVLHVIDINTWERISSAVLFDSEISTYGTTVICCGFTDNDRNERVYVLCAGVGAWAVHVGSLAAFAEVLQPNPFNSSQAQAARSRSPAQRMTIPQRD